MLGFDDVEASERLVNLSLTVSRETSMRRELAQCMIVVSRWRYLLHGAADSPSLHLTYVRCASRHTTRSRKMARLSSVLALALMAPAVAFMPQAPICRR